MIATSLVRTLSLVLGITVAGSAAQVSAGFGVKSNTCYEGSSSETPIVLVKVDQAPSAPLEVYYSVGGTATNGIDYQRLSGVAVIMPGQKFATVLIHSYTDGKTEGNETIDIIVTGSSVATNTVNAAYAKCTVTIYNKADYAATVDGPKLDAWDRQTTSGN